MQAFVADILSPDNRSGNVARDRLVLALWSYLEIFLYSGAFYVAWANADVRLSDAIVWSLGAGTLTTFDGVLEYSEWGMLVFVQIFASLSLVVLGVAGYLREKK